MRAAAARLRPQIERWLASPKRKPMLVHGPLQSGKKTVLRVILSELGYDVIEPLPRDVLDEFRDGSLYGRTAYLMDAQVFGTKRLPRVVRAPQIYVTHAPYDIGSKAELAARFFVFEMFTNIDCTRRSGRTDSRDHVPNYWQAVDIIRREPADNDLALQACDAAGEFLPEIVFRTYPSALARADQIDQAARTAEMLSHADTLRRHLPADAARFFDTLAPLRECRIASKQLQLKPPPPPLSVSLGTSIIDAADQRAKPAAKRQKKSSSAGE